MFYFPTNRFASFRSKIKHENYPSMYAEVLVDEHGIMECKISIPGKVSNSALARLIENIEDSLNEAIFEAREVMGNDGQT